MPVSESTNPKNCNWLVNNFDFSIFSVILLVASLRRTISTCSLCSSHVVDVILSLIHI